MKKYLFAIALMGLMLCSTNKTFSQATTAGFANVPQGGTEYLGWAGGNAITLDIANKNNQPIDFYTGSTPVKRMTILGSTNPGYVGIATASPSSVLHIDGNGTSTTTGEVFRTNGPASTTTYWRMLSDGTEYGSLFHQGSSTSFTIQATDNHLNLNSGHNGTALEAMRIVGGNGPNKRFVGIGNYASGSFSAAHSQLHQWITGNANVYHQFSNGNTTALDDTKGFKVGITYNASTTLSDPELISQQSGANMNFYTNSGSGATKRMTILSGGKVGINTSSPAYRMHVVANIQSENSPWRKSDGTARVKGTCATESLKLPLLF